jgi:hypothetical protein
MMGRPPIGERAMTGAERVQRHRERHRDGTSASIKTCVGLVRDSIATSLEREWTGCGVSVGETSTGSAMLRLELPDGLEINITLTPRRRAKR